MSRLTLLMILASAGCVPSEPGPTNPRPGDGERVAQAGAMASHFGGAACRELQRDAVELLAAGMECREDRACTYRPTHELVPDACLPTIACFVPVSTEIDLEPVIGALRGLDREYRARCSCPEPVCPDPGLVLSTCEDRSCELATTPGPPLAEAAPR